MTTSLHSETSFRKVFQGVADRRQMCRMFNRHAGRPARGADYAARLHAGEWFEIGEAEHDRMLEILPPLWMHGDMFALREFLAGSVTSVFFALSIGGRMRHFHGYCDLSDRSSPEAMRATILDREASPFQVVSRAERLEHIWSATQDAYRGYADKTWPPAKRGARTVLVFAAGRGAACHKLLDDLTAEEIAAKLPVQLRHRPEHVAA